MSCIGSCSGGYEVDVMELTSVQLHPLTALLPMLVSVTFVDVVFNQLLVDVRLDSGFLPVNT